MNEDDVEQRADELSAHMGALLLTDASPPAIERFIRETAREEPEVFALLLTRWMSERKTMFKEQDQ